MNELRRSALHSPRFAGDPRRDPSTVVDYWIHGGEALWFSKDPELDSAFRQTFIEAYEDAAARRLESWLASPSGGSALFILLDQFPRNAFRGTPRMYATDPLSREYASRALELAFDEQVPQELRIFFYLPLAHSERLADQERSVTLHRRLGYTANALRHREIIRRFGRFPHRNAILGRETTVEEQAFLADGGFSG